jgi:fatty-acyl-CoA synthase
VIADIPDITAKRAALSPGAVALEEPETGRTLTYAELDRRAAGAACLMAQQGVAEGDRVAILCRNRIEFFETLFGCAKLGAILVPLNWRMPAAELSLLLADCEPKLLLFGKEEAELADRLGGSMQMLSLEACARAAGKLPRGLSRNLARRADLVPALHVRNHGQPKGVIYNYRMAMANYLNIGTAVDIASTDTTACFLPIFHTAGINLHALPTLIAGGRVIVLGGAEPEKLVELLEARRLSTGLRGADGVPVAARSSPLRRGPARPRPPLGMRGRTAAGQPRRALSGARRARVQRHGDDRDRPHRLPRRPAGRLGADRIRRQAPAALPCPHHRRSRTGPAGRRGRRPAVRRPGRHSRLLAQSGGHPGGVHAGRVAALRRPGAPRCRRLLLCRGAAEGHVHLRRGECLSGRGGECALRPSRHFRGGGGRRADGKWGEVGHAYILPIPGVAALDTVELEAFCRARLAPYKVPKRFEMVSDFPRTAAGKIQKHLLRQAAFSITAPTAAIRSTSA